MLETICYNECCICIWTLTLYIIGTMCLYFLWVWQACIYVLTVCCHSWVWYAFVCPSCCRCKSRAPPAASAGCTSSGTPLIKMKRLVGRDTRTDNGRPLGKCWVILVFCAFLRKGWFGYIMILQTVAGNAMDI